MRYAMIMAGGAGTRLWPMSRRDLPKQLIRFIAPPGGEPGDTPISLLDLAARRLEGLIDPAHRYLCTSETYRQAIRREIPGFEGEEADGRILGEPVGRDTVNAVALGAAVLEKADREAVFAVLTADHIIEPLEVFRDRMDLGFRLVEQDPRRLVTFSIKPTYPATGFGYVERGTPIRGIDRAQAGGEPLAFHVERFVEKPELPKAQAYVESGAFGWNSGMFVWKASVFLEALRKYMPDNHEAIRRIQDAWGTPDQARVLSEIYPALVRTSVDYGVMEPITRAKDRQFSVCTVQMDLRWLDVGSWPSFGETVPPDEFGNRLAGPSLPTVVKGKNNLIVSSVPGHTVAVLGVDDLIVVHTPDATLVMPRSRAEELKELHGKVDDKLR
ncbi:MAG: mannose-1-phosphate guanylyltransferase [Phycisphaeraceae bacterium]|nr:mannose-1-phosphate guanylyltransferase [Phycisphaerae bacterium]MBX3393203.1 mannose-1-phosphate guanylyltransferase [Phycisphaeraceae bacterium]